jgi:hypothetical protein
MGLQVRGKCVPKCARQKIGVARRTIALFRPEFKEQSTILGLTQPEQRPLETVLGEHESEILIPFLSEIQELLSDRGGGGS